MNNKLGVMTITAAAVLAAILCIKHTSLGAMIPFKVVEKQNAGYKPVGKLILDGDYDLGDGWLVHTDGGDSYSSEFSLSKNGKIVYAERVGANDTLKVLTLPGTAGSGYLTDLNGDGSPDFLVEEHTHDARSGKGEQYRYTMYSLGNSISRSVSQQTDEPIELRDVNKDGVCEAIVKDHALNDFGTNHHNGPSEEVVCSLAGAGWAMAPQMMQKPPLSKTAFDQLRAEVDSKIIRYDTTEAGATHQRLELHPNAWEPIAHLIYQGNGKQARQLLDAVWSSDQKALLDDGNNTPISKDQFWHQLWVAITSSEYGDDIRCMNKL